MSTRLVGNNVIVAARQFNPSVLNQLWLVRNGLVGEGEFAPGCIISDALVQVFTPRFSLLVVPDQLQFIPNVHAQEEQSIIAEKVGGIVNRLPHTPYIAIGLNFVWHMAPEHSDVGRLSRELFFKEESEIFRRFDVKDALYGAYLSKDILGYRLKLDIKPIIVAEEGQAGQGRLQFAFNLHQDLAESAEAARRIEAMLLRWDEAKAQCREIVEAIEIRG